MTNENQTPDEKTTFESALEQLQASVKLLESGELNLEQALRCFEDGVRLTRICQNHLSVAEQRVDILMKGAATEAAAGGAPTLQPFPQNRAKE
ncbi:MAG TPA: exodeoxyribonuclease VII small subunit [Bdellovibrionota bacterium]|nr:exodeoxyribonuclease VII small subunit [Bdellovibrionota bacterium]